MPLYCPALQAVHVVPATLVIEPAVHALQLTAPAALYWPAVQLAHATVEVALNCPAPHATHVVPSVSVTEPPVHAIHEAEPEVLYWPATQLAHAAGDALYCPAGQAVQLLAPHPSLVQILSALCSQPVSSAHPSSTSASVHRRAPSPVHVAEALTREALCTQPPTDANCDSAQTEQLFFCS